MVIANAIHKLSNAAEKLCGALCIVLMVAMVLTTGAQIIWRVFFTALSWSEELTRYLLIWSTFLGGSIVYKRGGHISVTILQERFPAGVQKFLKILVHLICIAFCLIAVIYGFRYLPMQRTQLSAALRLPMWYMYLSIPVGCAIMLLHALDAILQILLEGKEALNP